MIFKDSMSKTSKKFNHFILIIPRNRYPRGRNGRPASPDRVEESPGPFAD